MSAAEELREEARRIAQLRSLQLSDALAEREFADLAQLACHVAGAPMALASLVDRGRQWLMARVGLEGEAGEAEISFCRETVVGGAPLIVEDARTDPRFADEPLVTGDLGIRFYAGFPVGVDDLMLGALCVLDREPRTLEADQLDALARLARQASAQLMRRRRAALLQSLEDLIHRHDAPEVAGRTDPSWIEPALAVGNELLGTSIAIVSQVVGDAYTVLHTASPPGTIANGDTFTLGTTYCSVTLAANDVVAIDDASQSEYGAHPCYREFGLATYIGAPLWVAGERVGTLNFSAPEPRGRAWDAEERALIAQLAQRFGHALAVGAQLEQQAHLIRVAADHLPGGLALVDREGALRFANRSFVAARGGPDAVPIGAPASEVLDEAAREHLPRALAGTPSRSLSEDRPGLAGDRVDIETIFTPARGPGGEVDGAIVLEIDVTAHRRADQGRASVQRMMDSLDQVGEGVAFYGPDDTLQLWNRAHERIMADAPGAVARGAPYRLLARAWAADDAATSDEPTDSLLAEHLAYHDDPQGTIERVRPGQRIFVLRELKMPDGGTVLTTSDVSELRRRERELHRSNEDLRQFAYVASHDLREPLRMVTSYVQLLEMRLEEHLDEEAERHMGYVISGTKRMRELIDGLMSFSLLERTTSAPVETPLDQVLDAALQALSVRIAETGAVIERSPLPRVPVDPVQLGQLFQNAVDNALKFSKPGTAPRVAVRGRALGDHRWEVTIEDNGIGLTEQFAAKAFDVFARGHSRDEYAGTGIGLAIVRKVVENHGGKIWFDLDYRDGARLVFTLARTA